MAQEDLVEERMSLSLQKANTGVELISNAEVLVLSWQVSNKGRIMRSNLCDIGVFARAQRSVPIARCCAARPD